MQTIDPNTLQYGNRILHLATAETATVLTNFRDEKMVQIQYTCGDVVLNVSYTSIINEFEPWP